MYVCSVHFISLQHTLLRFPSSRLSIYLLSARPVCQTDRSRIHTKQTHVQQRHTQATTIIPSEIAKVVALPNNTISFVTRERFPSKLRGGRLPGLAQAGRQPIATLKVIFTSSFVMLGVTVPPTARNSVSSCASAVAVSISLCEFFQKWTNNQSQIILTQGCDIP